MSDINPNARKAVNDRLIDAGSAAVGQMVDTVHSSVEKRHAAKEERARREAEEKAAKEKVDAAAPKAPTRTANVINNRRAAPAPAPARLRLPKSLHSFACRRGHNFPSH